MPPLTLGDQAAELYEEAGAHGTVIRSRIGGRMSDEPQVLHRTFHMQLRTVEGRTIEGCVVPYGEATRFPTAGPRITRSLSRGLSPAP